MGKIKYFIYAVGVVAAALLWLEARCLPASYEPLINWLIERTN